MDDLDKGKLADEIKVVNLFGKIETLKNGSIGNTRIGDKIS